MTLHDVDPDLAGWDTIPPDDAPPPGNGHGLRVANEPPAPRTERYTDAGNARRLVTAWGHLVRYVGPWNSWLIWDGARWKRDTRGHIYELAKKVASDLWHEDAEDRKLLVKWALQSEHASRIRAMVDLARSDPKVAIDPHQLDADPWKLNVRNGTIDLRTGERRGHDQRDLITKLVDLDHEIGATAPRFEAFLRQVLPDPDVREFVQRWFGYCLTGAVTEHKILFAFGAGANGKSTLLNTVTKVLGDYARPAAPDLLMRRRDDPHPTGLADLQGARLVLAAETGEGRRLDEALVKRLTGGDRVKARQLYADFFEFQPTHKFVVATNHRPEIAGTDHGIWRRIRLVPFDVVIADEDQDQELEEKLGWEAAGVLNWLLDGCLHWRTGGLTEPTAIVAATADYRNAMDVIGDFISDCCVLADGIQAKSSDLFKRYEQWCEVMAERPISARKFSDRLTERGLTKHKDGFVWWHGIGLSTLDEAELIPRAGGSEPTLQRETAAQRLDWDDLGSSG